MAETQDRPTLNTVDTVKMSQASSKDSRKMALHVSQDHHFSPNQYSIDTRQVVIDFLGLIPSNTPSLNVSSSSSSTGASHKKRHVGKKTSSTPTADTDWKQGLDSLPEVSLLHKYDQVGPHGKVLTPQKSDSKPQVGSGDVDENSRSASGHSRNVSGDTPDMMMHRGVTCEMDDSESDEEYTVDVIENVLENWDQREKDGPPARPSSIPLHTSTHLYDPSHSSSPLPPGTAPPTYKSFTRSPVRYRGSPTKARSQGSFQRDPLLRQGAIDRQHSHKSEGSDISQSFSECSSLMASLRSGSVQSNMVDVQHMDETDLEPMVKSHALPPLTIPLRDELQKEKENLEREYKEKTQVPMTPQTEVALMLSIIGDRVEHEYGDRFKSAMANITSQPDLNYEVLDGVTSELVDAMPNGWKKASLLLLFGQKLAFYMLSNGRGLGHLVGYLSKIVENQMAEFIIDKGGWQSISALEDLSPVSPSDILPDYHSDPGSDGEDMGPDSLHVYKGGQGNPTEDHVDHSDNTHNLTNLISPEAPSQADSAISTDVSHSSPAKGQADDAVHRDRSLESISSFANSTVETPLVEASRSISEQQATPPTGASGGECTEVDKQAAGVANVREEIRMLRQISKEFPEERKKIEKENQWKTNTVLGFTGGLLLCVATYILYRKMRRP